MFNLIATAIAWCYSLTHNYGLAIALLTLVIMVILTPLTLKGTRSMIAMQRLQPEMKRIQNRYKDDRQRLNEEMMAFYKENNINPVSSCLPLVLQLPVFIVLYRVLYGLTNPAPYGQDMGRVFAASAHAKTVKYFGAFHPQHLNHKSTMFLDLSKTHKMESFGLDLAANAAHVLQTNVAKAWPYLLLIVLIGISAWYQQKQITGRMPQSSQTQQQQMMMKIMPWFMPLYSFLLPAGLPLYFLISNGYRILQQGFITRTMYQDADGNPIVTTAVDTTSEPPKGFFASIREAAQESQKNIADNKAKQGTKGGQSRPGQARGGQARTAPAKGGQKQTGKGSGRANLAQGAKGQAPKGQRANGQGPKPKAPANRPTPDAKGGAKPAAPKLGGAKPPSGGRGKAPKPSTGAATNGDASPSAAPPAPPASKAPTARPSRTAPRRPDENGKDR